MEKSKDFQLFMTQNDEQQFCEELRGYNPNIFFLDISPSSEADISKRLYTSVVNSSSSFFSIVNFDLMTMEELKTRYKKYGEYYHFGSIAREQMQFLRSKPDVNDSHFLRNGRIADSYNIEDKDEKEWKNKVYDILKRHGEKVFLLYQTSHGCCEISIKPQKGIVAYPYALRKYNGQNGFFMKCGDAIFVGKEIALNN